MGGPGTWPTPALPFRGLWMPRLAMKQNLGPAYGIMTYDTGHGNPSSGHAPAPQARFRGAAGLGAKIRSPAKQPRGVEDMRTWVRERQRRAAGFTLVEVLLVVAIIILLAMIVIPRLLSPSRKAREAALKAQLHDMRSAIAHFESDCGDNPAALTDLFGRPADSSRGGGGVVLDTKAWQGPYLITPHNTVPIDPVTSTTDWAYDGPTGAVHSTSTGNGLNGEPYSTW